MKFNTKAIHGGQKHDPSTGCYAPVFKLQLMLKQVQANRWGIMVTVGQQIPQELLLKKR
jgi:hypothetical protein